jgi:signal transduction histidine kinase
MLIILNLLIDFFIGILFLLYGCDISFIAVIWIIRIVVLGIYLSVEYIRYQRRFWYCGKILKAFDKSYMVSDILSKPDNVVEEIYYDFLKAACKSMNDEVEQCKRNQSEYKNYIEKWIHEIKNPVFAIKLLCTNNKTRVTNDIERELESIDYLLEQVHYYVRSESLEKDYFIKKVNLVDVINNALIQYRTVLFRCGFSIEDFVQDVCVCCDEKWVSFILGQLITNAVKYRRDNNPVLKFDIEKTDQCINLLIEDNGCGISQADLPRIFDRGFTGSNRNKLNATGMGLFICKNLCDKMGLNISAESIEKCKTKIILSFPYGPLTEM